MNQSDDYVTIRLLFFAKAREFVGEKEVLFEVPPKITGKNLLTLIVDKYKLHKLSCNVVLALNENWIDLNSQLSLKNADEIAIIPPLSAGSDNQIIKMNVVKLTKEKICVESIYNLVCSPEYGAVSLFVGTTRNNFEGKVVTKLEYEAYDSMAIKALENICQTIRKKFDVGNIAILHRLGDVPIQEASVIIAISSKHREPGLEAVPFAINALKADVPIWKKEVYEDGKDSEWKENPESQNLMSSDCLQLYEEVIADNPEDEVPSHMIQINANLQEINRRINSFINVKRQQINVSNIQNFCLETSENPEESTCARVSAVLVRRKDSKSHLKVHRVENIVGPQTHGFDQGSFDTFRNTSLGPANCPPGAEERLTNAELYLKINQRSRDVFSRLKAIEDKILYLESISPEYFDFNKGEKQKRKAEGLTLKKTYSPSELEMKMQHLEAKIQRRSNNNT